MFRGVIAALISLLLISVTGCGYAADTAIEAEPMAFSSESGDQAVVPDTNGMTFETFPALPFDGLFVDVPPVALGAFIPDGAPRDGAMIDAFNGMVGANAKIVMSYQSWEPGGNERFDLLSMENVVSRDAMPLVTWQPMNPNDLDEAGQPKTEQPKYALQRIAGGDHDAYIRQWAQDARAWGKPFYLRFAHEMNGDWYPWSPGVNGNTSEDYVAAWQHVVDIFRQEGATNARWVWSPNNYGSSSLASVYPGDAYVDWVAIDGYNRGTSQTGSYWQSFTEVFGPAYDELAGMTGKPMMIAETASAEQGGDKAAWIRQGLLEELSYKFPRVRAVVWFNMDKEADWRVNSSLPVLVAYKEVAASPSFQGRLP